MAQSEDRKERVDRELIELLNELRVALPGVQVLFAFLLIVPFNQGWQSVTQLERLVYFASLVATAASTALLIAPTTYHRLHFRGRDKEQLLFTANRMAIAGSVFLLGAIAGSVFLVADLLFGELPAAFVALITILWFGWFWYGLPLSRRDR
jgi:Family of unknown function (DUF6328)